MLPILLPGNFFRSYIARGDKEGKLIYTIDDIEVTEFMLAVQETNFLYSFTLSALSALATALSSVDHLDWEAVQLILVSIVYSIYGCVVSIYLYGRKV